jgi:hypothetical protein
MGIIDPGCLNCGDKIREVGEFEIRCVALAAHASARSPGTDADPRDEVGDGCCVLRYTENDRRSRAITVSAGVAR